MSLILNDCQEEQVTGSASDSWSAKALDPELRYENGN